LETTDEAKHDRIERENKAKADAVQALLAFWAKIEPGKRSKPFELKRIIESAKKKFNVQDLVIRESMIRERATRGKVTNPTRSGAVSPMLEMEPLLVTFVICLKWIGHPLNPSKFLDLANSLIKGTPLEEKILASKKVGEIGAASGKKYYQNFMKRNSDEINSKCLRKFPADRTKSTITGELLSDLLKFMDGLKLLPRVENGPRPVLRLDGQTNSRFNLAFLQYMNDPNTKWYVALKIMQSIDDEFFQATLSTLKVNDIDVYRGLRGKVSAGVLSDMYLT
jgi:hypothetical protein